MSYLPYLHRTPSSHGNRTTFTWAAWIKREQFAAWQRVWTVQSSSGDAISGNASIQFTGDGYFRWFDTMDHSDANNNTNIDLISGNRLRDTSGWVHFMAVWDGIRENNEQRASLYINGQRVSYYNTQDWGVRDQKTVMNAAGNLHLIGYRIPSGSFSEHCPMSTYDWYFVDGQALTPDYFGYFRDDRGSTSASEREAQTSNWKGQWWPLAPKVVKSKVEQGGGFGTNGFYLPFNSANMPGADFHMEPDTILKLKTDEQQPKAEIKGNTEFRDDPYKEFLQLAVPGALDGVNEIPTGLGLPGNIGDVSHLIRGNGSAKVLSKATSGVELETCDWYYGSAMHFNAVSSDRLEVDITDGMMDFGTGSDSGTGDFTIEYWANPDTVNDERRTIYTYGSGGSQHLTHGISNQTVFVAVYDSSNNILGGQLQSGDVIVANQWQHIVIERFKSYLSLYVNGKRVAFTTTCSGTVREISANSGVLYIGRDPVNSGRYFKGYMADLRIYKGVAKYRGDFDCPNPYSAENFERLISYDNFRTGITGWGGDSGAALSHDSGHNGDSSPWGTLRVTNGGGDNTFAARKANILVSGQTYRIRGRVQLEHGGGSYEFRVRAGGSSTQWNNTSGWTDDHWYHFDTGAITADGASLEIGSLGGNITAFELDTVGVWQLSKNNYGGTLMNGEKPWRVVKDVWPTNVFARMNRRDRKGGSMQDGSLMFSHDGTESWNTCRATIGVMTGKWYWEVMNPYTGNGGNHPAVMLTSILGESGEDGWKGSRLGSLPGQTDDAGVTYYNNGDESRIYHWSNQSSGTAGSDSYGDGEITAVALDMDNGNGRVWFAKNGEWILGGDPAGGTTPVKSGLRAYADTWFPAFGHHYPGAYITCNFGQNPTFCGHLRTSEKGTYTDQNGIGEFKYEPPAGFLALCTKNLPEPTIKNPRDYFSVTTYSGSSTGASSQSGRQAVDVGLEADLAWIKCVSNSGSDWYVADTVRGGGRQLILNTEAIQSTNSNNGVYLGGKFASIGSLGDTNSSTYKYIAYCWKAGGQKALFNVDGEGYRNIDHLRSVTGIDLSTGTHNPNACSINTKSGLSIITYTTTSSTGTVAHGLTGLKADDSSATVRWPAMIITKRYDTATRGWHVGNTQLPGSNSSSTTNSHGYMNFSTGGNTTGNDGRGHICPDGKHFNVDTTASGRKYIAYIWKEIPGFSRFGTYVGNGSDDGTFVWCGFRPAFVMFKRADGGTENWRIIDTVRNPFNQANLHIMPSTSGAQSSETGMDIVSNGFKLINDDGHQNANNVSYFYAAFAEAPMQYATGR